ncbi:MAG: hypothetical protein ACREJB_01505, partial [Planctomycetaceae bacterium]
SLEGFCVLAFGKLGGEELNYSSDIDLVFLARENASRFWPLGQRLIKALMEPTAEGFLYRVDMRLRPWGRSGALVNSVEAHLDYLRKHGRPWEKQALVKARVIAGDADVGREFLRQAQPLIYGLPAEIVRASVREMKANIEQELRRQGRGWGEVKAGEGSIRDVEFVTQCLQLMHGGEHPQVRSIGTLDGLVRLADFGFLHADEYRRLTSGYVFLRIVEHALQLMHHKQTHSLPDDRRELAYLARRLDFPSAEQFLRYYEEHCAAIRRIFEKYVHQIDAPPDAAVSEANGISRRLAHMEPDYAKTFTEEEIAHHADLLRRLSEERLVEVEARPRENGLWQVTIAGQNFLGELSIICGLLFVYGFDIVRGNAFTEQSSSGHSPLGAARERLADDTSGRTMFVDVFEVRPPDETRDERRETRAEDKAHGPRSVGSAGAQDLSSLNADIWERYRADLSDLVR